MGKHIKSLLNQLTLEEKISMLAGVSGEHYMDTTPIERLGIPQLLMADGPHGVRWDLATAFPTGIAMAATWNVELMRRFGVILAHETLAKGRNMILGPCICIHRTPLGGRNFESFGEDPFLAGRIAVAYVQGVQQEKVATSTKHFACNNQERNRMTVSSELDERTLREIYLPAFKAAVQEGGTWSIMAAYNKVNGPYCCENPHLLNDILKEEWGFKGLVVSDWGAVHSTVPSAVSGLDLEMPGPGTFFNEKLQQAVESGEVDMELIDDKVSRLLSVMEAMGLLSDKEKTEPPALDVEAGKAMALSLAEESIVLLKNEKQTLPLNLEKIKKIALIGPNATAARLGGGGSSTVSPVHAVTPLEGISARCGNNLEVSFAMGCTIPGDLPLIETAFLIPPDADAGVSGLKAEYYANRTFDGEPTLVRVDRKVDFDWGGGSPVPGMASNCFSARWTGQLVPQESGNYELGTITTDVMRFYLDGDLMLDYHPEYAAEIKTVSVDLEAGKAYDLRIEFVSSRGWPVAKLGWIKAHNMEDAVALARASDVAIVVGGISCNFEGEGEDRNNLDLPGRQNELIRAVSEANPNTIVVLINGTPLCMDAWREQVPAIIEAWYPGQEGGHALAHILFGDVNPSGRLVITFPKKLKDHGSVASYPGDEQKSDYEEGIWVGYRHFDKQNVEPLFPFGHGLSYTSFEYSHLVIVTPEGTDTLSVEVTVDIENTGDCRGKEVVQLYVRDVEAGVERPPRELKAFVKVNLAAGEKQTVSFLLDKEAFAFYDVGKKGWVAEAGLFEIQVGHSSRDIRLRKEFRLKQTY